MNIGWRINKLEVGDIIIAYVPYEEGQGGKYRPVLIFILIKFKDNIFSINIPIIKKTKIFYIK